MKPYLRTFHGARQALPAGYAAAEPASGLRSDIRAAVRDEREALADPVRRVTREIVREELAAANPTPVQRMKAAAAEAHALSADKAKRQALALAAVRGFGVGLRSDELDALSKATADTIGCPYTEAALSLTTEDAR